MSESRHHRAESLLGRLVGITVLSFLVWWGLSSTTTLSEAACYWLSGSVAGAFIGPVITTARRKLAALIAPGNP
ncbi:hypothetical protein ACIBHX_47095 [Nonomuraea sp. NPDC050536]|uniref:hypothetical protein n=1 Tax=Nonomuraea sp. NPDC050536 TaxID=3364366 RepID=UPI0037C6EB4A